MTIFDNVAFPLRVRRLSAPAIRRKVQEALDLVRLPDIARRYPKELSGGQQQRVALARSLVYHPRIILMDEPLSALDKKLRDQMQIEIKQLHASLKVTIVYVTHDQGEALTLSDRICLMNDGKIEQIGTPRELYFQPVSLFAADFLGESNIFDAVVEKGGDAVRIRLAGATVIAGVPGCRLDDGASAKVMIRPECLSTSPRDGARTCELKGEVEDTIMMGGVTELRVRLPHGVSVAARELTSKAGGARVAGAPITLSFDPADVLILG